MHQPLRHARRVAIGPRRQVWRPPRRLAGVNRATAGRPRAARQAEPGGPAAPPTVEHSPRRRAEGGGRRGERACGERPPRPAIAPPRAAADFARAGPLCPVSGGPARSHECSGAVPRRLRTCREAPECSSLLDLHPGARRELADPLPPGTIGQMKGHQRQCVSPNTCVAGGRDFDSTEREGGHPVTEGRRWSPAVDLARRHRDRRSPVGGWRGGWRMGRAGRALVGRIDRRARRVLHCMSLVGDGKRGAVRRCGRNRPSKWTFVSPGAGVQSVRR